MFRYDGLTQGPAIAYRTSKRRSKSGFCLLLILRDTVGVSQIQSERQRQSRCKPTGRHRTLKEKTLQHKGQQHGCGQEPVARLQRMGIQVKTWRIQLYSSEQQLAGLWLLLKGWGPEGKVEGLPTLPYKSSSDALEGLTLQGQQGSTLGSYMCPEHLGDDRVVGLLLSLQVINIDCDRFVMCPSWSFYRKWGKIAVP